jgi:hypothetical protein
MTVGQSVCLGVEPALGLVTRFFPFFPPKVVVLSLWGALSDERSGLSFVSLLSIQSIVVSQSLHEGVGVSGYIGPRFIDLGTSC